MASDAERDLHDEVRLLRRRLDRERRARRNRGEIHRMAAQASGEITRRGVAEVIASGVGEIFTTGWVMVAFVSDDDVVEFVPGPTVPAPIARDWDRAPLATKVPICDVLRGDCGPIALPDPAAFAPWPILVAEAHRAGMASFYVEPIPSDGRPHAVIALTWPIPHVLLDDERDLLGALIAAAGPAFARAETTEVDHDLVATLQTWLLPAQLPTVDGLELATLYEPGRVAMDVGGDWYDVVRVDEHRSSIVIGDVVGHDARAAAEMGQVRHVLATHLMVTGDPARSLQLADDYFHRRSPDTMATALVMMFDSSDRTVELASAGHLAPVMAEASVPAHVVECGLGPPIGSGLGGYGSATQAFPRDALLVAFTDGVVEVRGETIDAGVEDFCRAVDHCVAEHHRIGAGAGPTVVDAVVAMLSERVADPDRTDDAAAVVCRATEGSAHHFG